MSFPNAFFHDAVKKPECIREPRGSYSKIVSAEQAFVFFKSQLYQQVPSFVGQGTCPRMDYVHPICEKVVHSEATHIKMVLNQSNSGSEDPDPDPAPFQP